MVDTIKFSEMTAGGDLAPNEKTPGLLSGANVLFNNPFPLLAPGSTLDRPAPDPSMYYRLRFNTTLESYEYYSPTAADWVQLEDSLDNYVGPFVTFTSAPDITGNFDLGTLTSGILKQTVLAGVSTPAIAVNAVDYWAPGDALTRTQVPVIGDDVTNKTYVDGLYSGNVKSVTGTANEIDVDNTDPANPILALSATLNMPGTFNIQGTTAVSAIINDDTMATAAATNLATALSIKNYIDGLDSGSVKSVTGTANQIDVDNTDPENPILSLPQDIDVDSNVNFNRLISVTDIQVNAIDIGQGPTTFNPPTSARFGPSALGNNATGQYNMAFGGFALGVNSTGNYNVAMGYNAGSTNNGDHNTFIGNDSAKLLGDAADGSNNTLVGSETGVASFFGTANFLEGSTNTWIGYRVTGSTNDISGTIAIGARAVADARTGTTSADSGPSVAIGSAESPVGFRGDDTAYPAGAANYWRTKINDVYYKLPILPDATALEWPAGPGTIALLSDIPSPGGGLSWLTVSGTSQTCAVNFGYISLNAAQTAFSLPAVAPVGSVIAFQGHGAGGWTVNAAAGQTIFLGITNTIAGGSITSDANSDNMYLLCVVEDAEWRVTSAYSRGLTYV